MLTTSSAPPAAWAAMGPVGLKASSQIDTPTRTPPTSTSGERRRCPGRSSAARRTPRSWAGCACGTRPGPGRRRTRRRRCRGRGPASTKPDDRRARGRCAAATRSSARRLSRDEAGLEQQVLGRVAGDGQLGEHGQVAALRPRPRSSAASDPVDVAVEVADGGVDLAQRDTEAGHDVKRTGDGCSTRRCETRRGRGRPRRAGRAQRRPGGGRAPRSTALDGDRRASGWRRLADRWPQAFVAVVGRQPQRHPADRDRPRRARRPGRPRRAGARRPVAAARRSRRAGPGQAPRPAAHHRPRPARPRRPGGDHRGAGRPGRRRCSAPRSAWPGPTGLAVIGMGKLGGRELNYASDVDVMFVEGDARAAPGRSWTSPGAASGSTPTCGPRAGTAPLTRSVDSYLSLLGPVGPALGVPGAAQGGAGGRRPRGRPGSGRRPRRSRCGAGGSTPTTCGRCGR